MDEAESGVILGLLTRERDRLARRLREQETLASPCPEGYWRWADLTLSGYARKSEEDLAADRARASERAGEAREELEVITSLITKTIREAGTVRLEHHTLAAMVAEIWPELVAADNERNAGMPMEMLSVEGYAGIDGISPEAYIIKVLRAERERRQDIDRMAADKDLLDLEILGAAAVGMPVVDWIIQHVGDGKWRTEDLSPVFLASLVRRLEERTGGGQDD